MITTKTIILLLLLTSVACNAEGFVTGDRALKKINKKDELEMIQNLHLLINFELLNQDFLFKKNNHKQDKDI